jgi:hypothetical protein
LGARGRGFESRHPDRVDSGVQPAWSEGSHNRRWGHAEGCLDAFPTGVRVVDDPAIVATAQQPKANMRAVSAAPSAPARWWRFRPSRCSSEPTRAGGETMLRVAVFGTLSVGHLVNGLHTSVLIGAGGFLVPATVARRFV